MVLAIPGWREIERYKDSAAAEPAYTAVMNLLSSRALKCHWTALGVEEANEPS